MVSRFFRLLGACCSLFMIAMLTSTAAIAGIGGIAGPKSMNKQDQNLFTQLRSGSMTPEQAVQAAKAAGFHLGIN